MAQTQFQAGKWEYNAVWVNCCSFARIYPEIAQLPIDTNMSGDWGFKFAQKRRILRFYFSTTYVLCFNFKQQHDYIVVFWTVFPTRQKHILVILIFNLYKQNFIPHSIMNGWHEQKNKHVALCPNLVSWTIEFCVVGTNLNTTLDNVEFKKWHCVWKLFVTP